MPISITYNLLASQVPTPTVSAAPIPSGSSGPFVQGMTLPTASLLNTLNGQVLAAMIAGSAGQGVLSGFALTASSGLTLSCSAGAAATTALVTNTGSQNIILPDNTSTNFIYVTGSGTIGTVNTLAAFPASAVFLGVVTTASGAITVIDYSGRVSVIDGVRFRQTADPYTPSDTPTGCYIITKTLGGTFWFDGTNHCAMANPTGLLAWPAQTVTLATDLTLTAESPNITYAICNGANRNVILASTFPPLGTFIQIVNYGDPSVGTQNYNVVVKATSLGATICTLTPGQTTNWFSPRTPASGVTAWPTSITPSTLV